MTDAAHTPFIQRLRLAGGLVATQAAVGALVALYLAYRDLTGGATDRAVALGVTLFALLAAGAFGAVAVAMLRGRAGARNPAIALELLLLAQAYFMIEGGAPAWGWPLLASGIAVIGLTLAPPPPSAR